MKIEATRVMLGERHPETSAVMNNLGLRVNRVFTLETRCSLIMKLNRYSR